MGILKHYPHMKPAVPRKTPTNPLRATTFALAAACVRVHLVMARALAKDASLHHAGRSS